MSNDPAYQRRWPTSVNTLTGERHRLLRASSFFLTGCDCHSMVTWMVWLVQSRPLISCLCSIWVYLFRLSILLLSSTFQKWKQIIFRKKIISIFLWKIIFWPGRLFLTRVGGGETNIFLILALDFLSIGLLVVWNDYKVSYKKRCLPAKVNFTVTSYS